MAKDLNWMRKIAFSFVSNLVYLMCICLGQVGYYKIINKDKILKLTD